MKRYAATLLAFYKASIQHDLEYRANFFINILLSVVSIGWSVAGISLFFIHTDQIGGWNLPELLVVLGLFLSFLGIVETFLSPNVADLMEHIRTGTMDFILTKPINSQFHATLRRINIWRSVDLIFGLSLIVYGLGKTAVTPSFLDILLFFSLYL